MTKKERNQFRAIRKENKELRQDLDYVISCTYLLKGGGDLYNRTNDKLKRIIMKYWNTNQKER